ncbi:MAG: hypothetical protein ACTSP1_01515, partial [Candidatus Freyarchaeota archaeon]
VPHKPPRRTATERERNTARKPQTSPTPHPTPIFRTILDPLPVHPNPGLVEDDVACALQGPLEVAPRGAVGAVHPPANRLVAALEPPLVEKVLPHIAEAHPEPKI